MYLYVLIRAKLCLKCTYMSKIGKDLPKKCPQIWSFCISKSKIFSISLACLNVQARQLIASQLVCKPHDIYDETTCFNCIKLCSKEFYMISSFQSTYFYLQNGPNALIFAQFGVLIIRTMAVPPLHFAHQQHLYKA